MEENRAKTAESSFRLRHFSRPRPTPRPGPSRYDGGQGGAADGDRGGMVRGDQPPDGYGLPDGGGAVMRPALEARTGAAGGRRGHGGGHGGAGLLGQPGGGVCRPAHRRADGPADLRPPALSPGHGGADAGRPADGRRGLLSEPPGPAGHRRCPVLPARRGLCPAAAGAGGQPGGAAGGRAAAFAGGRRHPGRPGGQRQPAAGSHHRPARGGGLGGGPGGPPAAGHGLPGSRHPAAGLSADPGAHGGGQPADDVLPAPGPVYPPGAGVAGGGGRGGPWWPFPPSWRARGRCCQRR